MFKIKKKMDESMMVKEESGFKRFPDTQVFIYSWILMSINSLNRYHQLERCKKRNHKYSHRNTSFNCYKLLFEKCVCDSLSFSRK